MKEENNVPQTVSDEEWEQLSKGFREKQERIRAMQKLEEAEREITEKLMKGADSWDS